MTKAPEEVAFAMEVNSRLNELITWVLENSPTKDEQLCSEDFAEVRDIFCKLACGIDAQKIEPEPSEGGAQYINVTPAPWP